MSDKPTNCPNCGAPLKGGKCEYCGTITNDVASDDVASEIARLELEKQSIMNQMESQRQTTLLMLNGIYKPFPPQTGGSFL